MRNPGPKVLVVGYRHFRPGFTALFDGNPNAEYAEKEGVWDRMSRKQRARFAARFDVIHYFWAKVPLSEILRIRCRRPGIRIIFHFIGSDVLLVAEKRRRRIEYALHRAMGVLMFADHTDCVRELNAMRLKARWLPFVNHPVTDREKPLPETFSAIAYVPCGNESFYRLDWVLDAAGRLPEIPFTVFPDGGARGPESGAGAGPGSEPGAGPGSEPGAGPGSGAGAGIEKGIGPANVRFAGRLDDVPAEMARHSVFLRLPRHDGLPSTLIEALTCARQVIWTFHHPFCHRVGGADELVRLLQKLKAENRPNREGKSYVLKTYPIGELRSQYSLIWRNS
jgi:glycosyltransferase involved in cell wall biosynthesis